MVKDKICTMCNAPLKKKKRKPYTATRDGHLYFDYYKCPKCNVVYAFPKEESNESNESI